MVFTVPQILVSVASAICGVILIVALIGLASGKEEGKAIVKVALVGLVILLFIDGITQGVITTAIGGKIAELIGQI